MIHNYFDAVREIVKFVDKEELRETTAMRALGVLQLLKVYCGDEFPIEVAIDKNFRVDVTLPNEDGAVEIVIVPGTTSIYMTYFIRNETENPSIYEYVELVVSTPLSTQYLTDVMEICNSIKEYKKVTGLRKYGDGMVHVAYQKTYQTESPITRAPIRKYFEPVKRRKIKGDS